MVTYAMFTALAVSLFSASSISTIATETETRPILIRQADCGRVPISVRPVAAETRVNFSDISFKKHNFSLIISVPGVLPANVVEFRSNELLLVMANEEAYRLNINWRDEFRNSFAERLCSKFTPLNTGRKRHAGETYWTSSDRLERFGAPSTGILNESKMRWIGSFNVNKFQRFVSIPRQPIVISHVDSLHGPLVTVDSISVSSEPQLFYWDRFTFSKRDVR